MKTRIVFKVTWTKNQDDWDKGYWDIDTFLDFESAFKFGQEKEKLTGFTFFIEVEKQFWKNAPIGQTWREERFGWEYEESEDLGQVWDSSEINQENLKEVLKLKQEIENETNA